MKTIKILGTGCTRCKQTESVMKEAVSKLNIDAEIQKIEDIQEIMHYDIMATPAVVIDEVVVLKGFVPTYNEAIKVLQ